MISRNTGIIAASPASLAVAFSSHSSFSALYGYGYGKPAEFLYTIFFFANLSDSRAYLSGWICALFVTG